MSACGCRGSSSTGSDDGCGCPAADLVSVLERSGRDRGSLSAFAQPVNQASLRSVLATSTVAQDGGGGDPPGGGGGGPDLDDSQDEDGQGEDPESDSESGDESFADVPCIVAQQPWGCLIRSGECDPGVTEPDKKPRILWSDPQTVRLYNLLVGALGLESVLDMMGSTPEKACGTPDEHIRCGENRIIHAVIQNIGSTIPTPRLVEAALELAKRGAKDAATEKACKQPEDPSAPAREDCSKVKGREGEGYRDTWHCAFAVNFFDGDLATRFNAAWEKYAGDERAQGRDDPGTSPLRDAGSGYYIGAAAQVTWECESKDSSGEDPPPPEPEPEPKPEPGDPGDGDVPQPPTGPEEERAGSATPPDPPVTFGCKTRDKDGNEVPATGENGKPAKCCYGSPKDKPTHCVNHGCWGKHQACVPTADGTDCECLKASYLGTRQFPKWSVEDLENPDNPDKPPNWKYPDWNDELEKEGKSGGGDPPGGGANGDNEAGDDDPFGVDEERSELRSVSEGETLASVEDDWRPSGAAIQSSLGLPDAGGSTSPSLAEAGGRDARSSRPAESQFAVQRDATMISGASPTRSSPSSSDQSVAHPLDW